MDRIQKTIFSILSSCLKFIYTSTTRSTGRDKFFERIDRQPRSGSYDYNWPARIARPAFETFTSSSEGPPLNAAIKIPVFPLVTTPPC